MLHYDTARTFVLILEGAMSSSVSPEAIDANPNSVQTTLARKEDRSVWLPSGKSDLSTR